MIAWAPIVDARSNFGLNKDSLDRVYLDHQCDIFKIDNAMVYQILSKVLTDMDAFVYLKQRKAMHDGQAAFFDIHKCFLGPDHVARQVTDAQGKLQNSHHDGE